MEKKVHGKIEIDATGMVLGRLASRVAILLMGKHKPTYVPHIDSGASVVILNPSKIKLTGKKLEQKEYIHHSNYPGGLKRIPIAKVFEENPAEVIKKAVSRMIPRNKLFKNRMNRLTFKSTRAKKEE